MQQEQSLPVRAMVWPHSRRAGSVEPGRPCIRTVLPLLPSIYMPTPNFRSEQARANKPVSTNTRRHMCFHGEQIYAKAYVLALPDGSLRSLPRSEAMPQLVLREKHCMSDLYLELDSRAAMV